MKLNFKWTLAVGISALLWSSSGLGQPNGAKNTGNSTKKSSLETSKKVKFKDHTEVNFDEAHIEGSYKSPLAQMINERDQEIKRGFISVRTHWHDQMIISTSGLSQ